MGFLFDKEPFQGLNITLQKIVDTKASKYPRIAAHYESLDREHVYVSGTATHGLDWRRSAGGFIHGFRYTARALAHLLGVRYESTAWPALRAPLDQLVNALIRRLNEGSGIYQMLATLGDVALIDVDENGVHILGRVSCSRTSSTRDLERSPRQWKARFGHAV